MLFLLGSLESHRPSGLPISVSISSLGVIGATGENRSKIGDLAPTWSVLLKISGRRGHPQSPSIIFARLESQ